MNSSTTLKRGKSINWINALKAICILFVLFRHTENYYGQDMGWFDGLFLPFYVNAFFFVSGYLLFWKQLSEPKITETSNGYLTGGGQIISLECAVPDNDSFHRFFGNRILSKENDKRGGYF